MARMPAETAFYVGFGSLGGNHELLGQTTSDEEGMVSLTVEVPSWADQNSRHFFFLAYSDQRPFTFSDPFLVADAQGVFVVEGEITAQQGSCWLMQAEDEVSYVLVGETRELTLGVRAVVRGTLAEPTDCAEGLPVSIRSVRVRGARSAR